MLETKDTKVLSPINFYGWEDDGRPLPFVQLGDVFVRDAESMVFVVINASCDLQLVPEEVSKARKTKGRLRGRNDCVLLLPGEVCGLGMTAKRALTTELFHIDDTYYAIEWKPKQILSVPHCCLRALLEDRGFRHRVRLQMDRAIELQQEAFASNSRVGLEVQPQLSKPVGLRICAKVAGVIEQFGDDIPVAGGIFHYTREHPVIVVNPDCLKEVRQRLLDKQHNDLAQAVEQFENCFIDLHRCPFVVERGSHIEFKMIMPNNRTRKYKKIRVSLSSRPNTPENIDGQLCLHFFDEVHTYEQKAYTQHIGR